MNKKFNLLLAVIFSLVVYHTQAFAMVGKVEFSTAGVTAENSAGVVRALTKGTEVDVGDTIQTNGARVQVRFTDGGYVSLQPNTVFKVDDYAFTGKSDGTEKSFFSLIKGGMRAITGFVGKTNKQSYRLNTPVATIGIRGTEFVAEYDTKLLVKVGEGAVYIANNGGDITLYSGQTGAVSHANDKPTLSTDEPSVGSAGPGKARVNDMRRQYERDRRRDEFTIAEQVDASGTPLFLLRDYVFTGQYADASFGPGPGFVGATESASGTFKFNAARNFVGGSGTSVKLVYLGGQTVDKASLSSGPAFTGGLSWMRLSGGTIVRTNLFTNAFISSESISNEHLIFGQATPLAVMSALSAANVTALYNFVGGTSSTNAAGVLGSVTSGSILVAFGGAPNVSLAMALTNGPNSYTVSGATGTISGATFNIPSGSVTGCISACSFNADGFFNGTSAANIGLAYTINDVGNNVTGVAAFKR